MKCEEHSIPNGEDLNLNFSIQVIVMESTYPITPLLSDCDNNNGNVQSKYSLTLILQGGGVLKDQFYFYHEKSPHFVVHFILNNIKLTPPRNLGHYAKMPILLWLFQKFEKLSQKKFILSMDLLSPPPPCFD